MAMMYSAYFDASGKQDAHSAITVAGAVAPVKKWIRFEHAWKKVLDDAHVGVFHATDFAASLGEYKGWKGDKERRSLFLRRLCKIIKDNTNKFFLVTVEIDAWNSVNREYLLSEVFQSPFALAGISVIGLARIWARNKKLQYPIKFIFEDGDEDKDWSGLKGLCGRWKIVPVRLPKPDAIPCQVGDLLAWKARIAYQNSLRLNKRINPHRFDPELFDQVLEELRSMDTVIVRPANNKVYGRDALISTCRKSNVQKRSSIHPRLSALD